jgi:hypothetical protein
MAWTTPKTNYTGADTITASEINAVGDNLVALKDPPTTTSRSTSAYNTTSTSFVDVDATDYSLDITSTGGDLMVGFVGTGRCGSTNSTFIDITLDGTRQGNANGITQMEDSDVVDVSFVFLIEDVAAGAHTIRLQYRTDGAANPARINFDGVETQFWVREVS